MKEPKIINEQETYLRDKKDMSTEEREDKSDASFDNEQKLDEEMKKEYETNTNTDTDEKKREHGSLTNKTSL